MACYEKWYPRVALILLLMWGLIAYFGPSLIVRHDPSLTAQGQEYLVFPTAYGWHRTANCSTPFAVLLWLRLLPIPFSASFKIFLFVSLLMNLHRQSILLRARCILNFRCAYKIQRLLEKEMFQGSAFYRAEPAGKTVDMGNTGSRKGYALVQGGFYSCGKQVAKSLPIEAEVANRKGTVSLITGTCEFFFNLEDHLEWNGSFTAWGEVADDESWQVLNKIVSLPTRQEKHPSGTVMRILLDKVAFSVLVQKA